MCLVRSWKLCVEVSWVYWLKGNWYLTFIWSFRGVCGVFLGERSTLRWEWKLHHWFEGEQQSRNKWLGFFSFEGSKNSQMPLGSSTGNSVNQYNYETSRKEVNCEVGKFAGESSWERFTSFRGISHLNKTRQWDSPMTHEISCRQVLGNAHWKEQQKLLWEPIKCISDVDLLHWGRRRVWEGNHEQICTWCWYKIQAVRLFKIKWGNGESFWEGESHEVQFCSSPTPNRMR